MKKPDIRILFPALCLAIILSSWLIQAPGAPYGYVARLDWPRLSLRTFLDGTYQKQASACLRNNFPSLKYLLYFKNDLFEFLNLGQFHSGYYGNIQEGKNGVLYEKDYLKFAYDDSKYRHLQTKAADFAQQLAQLQELLAARNVQFAFIQAPDKTSCRGDSLPPLWKWRYGGLPAVPMPFMDTYEGAFARRRLVYINCLTPIIANKVEAIAFPDQGTHWSMYAAGLCARTLAAKLHELNPARWPQIRFVGRSSSAIPQNEENDLARLLNLYPPYSRGDKNFYLAKYVKIARPVPLIVTGDSFANQLVANLKAAGYLDRRFFYQFTNHIPEKEVFLNAIAHTDLLLMVFTNLNVFSGYAEKMIAAFINFLQPG